MQRTTAKITKWVDAKGFGFARSNDNDKDIFLHVSSFPQNQRRPKINDRVSFVLSQDKKGRVCGVNAKLHTLGSSRVFNFTSLFLIFIALGFFAALSALVVLKIIPPLIPYIYLIMSGFTFAAYSMDKFAAKSAIQRTPENVLQFLALIGGWPGALVAQQMIRHKSRKLSFQVKFWIMVIINCATVTWLFNSEYHLVPWFVHEQIEKFVTQILGARF